MIARPAPVMRMLAVPLVLLAVHTSKPAVDLVAEHPYYGMAGGFRVGGSGVAQGGTASFMSFQVRNTGSDPAANITARIWVSADEQFTGSDTPIWSTTISSVAAGSVQVVPVGPVTLPVALSAGSYWFAVIVDDASAIAEADESNNLLKGNNKLVVLAPVNADLQFDLQGGSGNTLQVIGAGGTYMPDFYTAGAPVQVAPDGDLVFVYRVKNVGPQATPGFRATYYLSPDNNITSADTYLGSHEVQGVAAGGWILADWSAYKLPNGTSPGTYYAGVIIDSDNQVIETYGGGAESNNSFSRQITVLNIPSDETRIWRVRLRLRTGNVADAKTDDPVFVKLGSNTVWLDYARDDFERSDDFTYDMVLQGVEEFKDLSSLTIGKQGTNGWCLDKVHLEVNGKQFFYHDFPGTCQWLDGSNTWTVFTYGDLRNYSSWGTINLPPLQFTKSDIASFVQAIVGNEMHDQEELFWGHFHGDPVEVTRESANSVKVDLDMAADIGGPDPDVDVDFVISFSCSCDGLGIDISNLHVGVSSGWYPGFVENWINGKVRDELKDRLDGMSRVIGLGPFACPNIVVTNAPDVLFTPATAVRDMSLSLQNPPLVRPGATFDLIYTVRNLGNSAPGAYSVSSTFTTDGLSPLSLDVSDGREVRPCSRPEERWSRSVTVPSSLSCNTFAKDPVRQSRTSTSRIDITIPSVDASRMSNVFHTSPMYEITSQLTPDIADANVTNDVVKRPIYVSLPDLRFGSLTASSSRVRAGKWLGLTGAISNQGAFATGQLRYSIRIVNSAGTSIQLGSGTAPSLAPGAVTRWNNLQLQIPHGTPPGSYTLVGRVDPVAATRECSLTNNERSLSIMVQLPDITIPIPP